MVAYHQSTQPADTKPMDALAVINELTRHRDAWRNFAYGVGPKPSDFLYGNASKRQPTKLEKLEAESHKFRAAVDRLFAIYSQEGGAENRLRRIGSYVSSLLDEIKPQKP